MHGRESPLLVSVMMRASSAPYPMRPSAALPSARASLTLNQLIDNSLCGYRFAGLPRILAIAREAKTRNTRVPIAVV
jgi:hypothetical protein